MTWRILELAYYLVVWQQHHCNLRCVIIRLMLFMRLLASSIHRNTCYAVGFGQSSDAFISLLPLPAHTHSLLRMRDLHSYIEVYRITLHVLQQRKKEERTTCVFK